jgi:chemotaxis protein MotA
VLSPDEVAGIKLSVLEIEKRGVVYLVSDFIKKACTQYRNDNSISETLQVLEVQIENTKGEMEGDLSVIRYLIATIMSVGFIGTVIGLSRAIGNAHLAQDEGGLPILTSYLNIAFDTTLVALVLVLILNFIYHNYLGIMDNFYAQSKRYIVDNLISRIYKHA